MTLEEFLDAFDTKATSTKWQLEIIYGERKRIREMSTLRCPLEVFFGRISGKLAGIAGSRLHSGVFADILDAADDTADADPSVRQRLLRATGL